MRNLLVFVRFLFLLTGKFRKSVFNTILFDLLSKLYVIVLCISETDALLLSLYGFSQEWVTHGACGNLTLVSGKETSVTRAVLRLKLSLRNSEASLE